jgi:hypothetical protein
MAGPCPLLGPQLESLLDAFKVLPDRRSGHGLRHWQPFVLACAAVATLMGAGGYQGFEDLCRKLTQRQLRALGCRRNKEGRYVPPSDSTFFRVISQLDAALFEQIMGSWLLHQEVSVLSRLAVDGKVLRGSGRNDGKPLQLLSAVTHRLRLTLGQIPIEEKSIFSLRKRRRVGKRAITGLSAAGWRAPPSIPKASACAAAGKSSPCNANGCRWASHRMRPAWRPAITPPA